MKTGRSMRRRATSLREFSNVVSANKALVKRLATRDFTLRYRGSMLGSAWAILTPLLTAFVFTVVFSKILHARWQPGAIDSPFDFTLILLVGLAVHGMFAETLTKAPLLVVGNPSYVTRVIFALEILPIVTVINASLSAAIILLIVILANLILNGSLHYTVIFLPLILIPYFILLVAFALLFAAIGVFLRDLSQIVALLVTLSLFLTPIFYPVTAVPRGFRTAMYLNPLTFIVEQAREVVLFGRMPEFLGLSFYAAAAVAALAASYWLFQRMRPGFADVV